VEVAKEKSRIACERVRGPVLIEDTALCFDALGPELPGPYIKWFLEDLGHDGLNKLLVGFDTRAARAICTFAYCESTEAEPIVFQGVTKGKIVQARGPKKFGWDPVFEPDHPSGQTYAEMPAEVKNALSHRAKALQLVKEHFGKC
jgi:inosine triphosphate pyrophosphatase